MRDDESSSPRRHHRRGREDDPTVASARRPDVVINTSRDRRPTATMTVRVGGGARRSGRFASAALAAVAMLAVLSHRSSLRLPLAAAAEAAVGGAPADADAVVVAAASSAEAGDSNNDGFGGREEDDGGTGASGGGNGGGRTAFRVFQTLPREPSSMTPSEVEDMHRIIRATYAMVFAPSSDGDGYEDDDDDDLELALDVYSPSERREYLVRRGNRCHPRGMGVGGGNGGGFDPAQAQAQDHAGDVGGEDAESLQWYDVLSRYDSLMSAAVAASSPPSSSDAAAKGGARSPSKGKRSVDAASSSSSARSSPPLPPGASSELERAAIELFKFCVLYNADGHAYWGWDEQLLIPFRDVVGPDFNYGVVATAGAAADGNGDGGGGGGGVEVEGAADAGNNDGSAASAIVGGDGGVGRRYVHESFLSISPYAPAMPELSSMIRLLLETPDDVLASSPLLLPRELHRLIAAGGYDVAVDGGGKGGALAASASAAGGGADDGEKGGGAAWTLLRNSCIPLAEDGGGGPDEDRVHAPDTSAARRMATRCPLSGGGYCCLAFLPDNHNNKAADGGGEDDAGRGRAVPVMALRHPVGGWTSGGDGGGGGAGDRRADDGEMMPYALARGGGEADAAAAKSAARSSASSSAPPKLGGVAVSDMPYVSTVRLVANNTSAARPGDATKFPTHPADAPNFFDMLFENDCLPYRKECHRCLKDVSNERPGDGEPALTKRNACAVCKVECPCYCDILCKVRPPPKPVTRTYSVRLPRYRKEPERLVPKIIHQTWFEPVTKDKYPNMSRLIESWKKSGWEYYFYDDDTAGDFLGTHFPPEVREAYESIIPGAFKADLFRYCVLLIRGGVYSDMDVLLQTNLDEAIANDVGFMTPLDNPGIEVGHRSCLWNGLIASAPGHPFLARTIEIVVNNIRNRFTAVDYDDMLCPNPILSVSHTVDTLFTCGPCILGAGINNLLERHMQTEFEIGDVDIWRGQQSPVAAVRPDDPRLLIPGRTVILEQNKNDMGAHRFTWVDRHLIVAATDMPDYDDRPPSKEHYSKTHEKAGVYGMRKLYTDTKRANEEIRIVVEKL